MTTPNNPWDDVPHIWEDEKSYMGWLRSQTRRVWSKHPIKTEYKKARRYKAPVGVKGKEVFVSDCEICGEQCRNTQVDHIVAGGSFNNWKTYTEWAKRILWVTFSDIRELCIPCHEIVTLSQKKGITFEEAAIEKKVIAVTSLKATPQKEWLLSKGITPESNADKRKIQIREVILSE